jgi:Tol biopolymer transport system component/DNA-binding winged helix-turn-helix (wHTH) protein
MTAQGTYRFDGITVDIATVRVSRRGEELALEPKSFRLLQFLIENRERVVGKEEIFRIVWEETAVTDNALTRAVAQIRKALGDDPKQARYIETFPTVGYRFIGELRAENEDTALPARSRPRSNVLVAVAVGVMVVAAVGIWIARLKASQASVSTPVPLTSYRGSENSPSFSPDGNQVAFEWDGEKQDNFDIYVKVVGSEAAPLRLTTNAAPDQYPTWSPDGRTVAFLRTTAPDKAELRLVPALGGPERRLAEFPIRIEKGDYRLVWAADSMWVIASAFIEGHAVLIRVSVDSGEFNQITFPEKTFDDVYPAMSPDGRMLMFTRNQAFNVGGYLYAVNLDGNASVVGDPYRIPTGQLRFQEGIFTADGKEIIARRLSTTVRMPVEGTDAPQPIPWLGLDQDQMAVSRRGNRLAYSVFRGDANVWRIDLREKVPQPERLIASTFRDVYPQYSPDGRWLTFHSMRTGGFPQVWISNAQGGEARQLTFGKTGMAGTAHWAPTGDMLAFDSNTTHPTQIYTMNVDGGKMRQLTSGSLASFDPAWSRDGQWLYFTTGRSGRDEVWKMPATGGDAVQVTRNGAVHGVESQDGKTMYFSKGVSTGAIWKMSSGGGPEVKLVDSIFRTNFAVTTQGIYYMTAPGRDGNATLMLY